MTELEQIIGYTFKNPELLKEALTHSSYTNGKHLRSNERLEFLGDSVLSIVVSEHLFENLTNLPEGQLTKIRASVDFSGKRRRTYGRQRSPLDTGGRI